MSAQAPSAPEQAKPKRNTLPIVLIIVVVLACLCILVVVIAALAVAPSIQSSLGLAVACTMKNSEMTSQECTTWVNTLKSEHEGDYQACFDESETPEGTNSGTVYDCLDDRNLGPDDLP